MANNLSCIFYTLSSDDMPGVYVNYTLKTVEETLDYHRDKILNCDIFDFTTPKFYFDLKKTDLSKLKILVFRTESFISVFQVEDFDNKLKKLINFHIVNKVIIWNENKIDTYEKYINRMIKNPCFTQDMWKQNKTTKLYCSDPVDNPTNSTEIEISQPWGIAEYVQKIFQFPKKELWYIDENNLYRSSRSRYNENGIILSNGVTQNVIDDDKYGKKSINGNRNHTHKDFFESLVHMNMNDIIINHIHGDKQENSFINLEPSNTQHNGLHACEELGKGRGVRIKKVNLNDQTDIEIFNSITSASKDIRLNGTKDIDIDHKKLSGILISKRVFYSSDLKYYYTYLDEEYVNDDEIIDSIDDTYVPITSIKMGDYNYIFSKYDYLINKESKIVKRLEKGFLVMKKFIVQGYETISLTDDNGNHQSFRVHRVMLVAHLKGQTNREDYKDYTILFVDHINKIKSDNNLLNLRWVTDEENSRLANGYKAFGIISIHKCKSAKDLELMKKSNLFRYDAIFADAEVLHLIGGLRIDKINAAAARNDILREYIFDYISHEYYQRFKNQGETIVLKKTLCSMKGEIKSLVNNNQPIEFNKYADLGRKLGIPDTWIINFLKKDFINCNFEPYNAIKILKRCYYLYRVPNMQHNVIHHADNVVMNNNIEITFYDDNIITLILEVIVKANADFERKHHLKYFIR